MYVVTGIVAVLAIFAVIALTRPRRNLRGYGRGVDRADRMNGAREIISRDKYRALRREEAKLQRCPKCHRAPDRPCIRNCRGRIDVNTDWTG